MVISILTLGYLIQGLFLMKNNSTNVKIEFLLFYDPLLIFVSYLGHLPVTLGPFNDTMSPIGLMDVQRNYLEMVHISFSFLGPKMKQL